MASDAARIDFERSGGFAGITLGASVDTAQLPPEQALEIQELLDKIDLAALGERPLRLSRGADRFQYDITVTRGSERYTASIGESEVSPELRPLIDRLTEIARRR